MGTASLRSKNELEDKETIAAFLGDAGFVSLPNGTVWLGIGPCHKSARPQPGKLSIYAPDFYLTDATPWRIYDDAQVVSILDLIEALTPVAERPVGLAWERSKFEAFQLDFEGIQSEIAAGRLLKAVPFIERSTPVEVTHGQRASILLSALKRIQGQPLSVYGFWEATQGLVGTTPETLFEQKSNPERLSTMALAGTRTPSSPPLLDDPKEVTEHQIVVDAIVERLSPLGEVKTGETTEIELPNLAHLITPIEVNPSFEVTFDEWVVALHPTPAIGAWPLDNGWAWLKAQPNAARRDHYGAPFGYIAPDSDTGTCLVGIRNVQWKDGELKVLAGCGIIAASQLEREWIELNAKLDSIQTALGL